MEPLPLNQQQLVQQREEAELELDLEEPDEDMEVDDQGLPHPYSQWPSHNIVDQVTLASLKEWVTQWHRATRIYRRADLTELLTLMGLNGCGNMEEVCAAVLALPTASELRSCLSSCLHGMAVVAGQLCAVYKRLLRVDPPPAHGNIPGPASDVKAIFNTAETVEMGVKGYVAQHGMSLGLQSFNPQACVDLLKREVNQQTRLAMEAVHRANAHGYRRGPYCEVRLHCCCSVLLHADVPLPCR